MPNFLSLLLKQLAMRLSAIIAGTVSSEVQAMRAAVQAEQQSQLEDLARQYEADGKPEIAAGLRRRLVQLDSNDLAMEGVEVLRRMTDAPPQLAEARTQVARPTLPALPDFTDASPPAKKRRKAAEGSIEAEDQGGAS